MAESPRKPRAVRIGAPDVVVARTDEPRAAEAKVVVAPEPEAAPVEIVVPRVTPRRSRWGRLLLAALGGLVSLAVYLWIDRLVRDLFARADWLGWLGIALVLLALVALVAIGVREAVGLARLARIDHIRTKAAAAALADDEKAARDVASDLEALYAARPDLARGRAALAGHLREVIDGRDIVRLAERELMAGLDAEARRIVMSAAKRVAVVTAASPRALVDVLVVAAEAMRVIRRLSAVYGGRPGTIGFWRLARAAIGHLAVTGGMAVGDSVIQQVVGHGIAARLSARLGEGMINGLLTARIGVAAVDVCRPLPFLALPQPGVKDFLSELTKLRGSE